MLYNVTFLNFYAQQIHTFLNRKNITLVNGCVIGVYLGANFIDDG